MINAKALNAISEWSSPSNLAIVKYWGKKGQQEPLNPNISFSLKHSVTKTRVSASKEGKAGSFTFTFNGKSKPSFHQRIHFFLNQAKQYLPFIDQHHLYIESSANFPHSSGIASSASSMSALALCLVSLHNITMDKDPVKPDLMMASSLARMGSGSAARSVYGYWNLWGAYPRHPESSNMYAIPINYNSIDASFRNLRDAILIVDPSQKAISSSEGHSLMQTHPYNESRIKQAFKNTENLLQALAKGDWNSFIEIAENEALSLHALMMSSSPSYTLLKPNTLLIIDKIRELRTQKNIMAGFSMDAGPNVHLLYPEKEEEVILPWIKKELRPLCYNGQIIFDEIGQGPENIYTNF